MIWLLGPFLQLSSSPDLQIQTTTTNDDYSIFPSAMVHGRGLGRGAGAWGLARKANGVCLLGAHAPNWTVSAPDIGQFGGPKFIHRLAGLAPLGF